MKASPCLHPKYIKCRDGVFRSVPCGTCSACVVNKGFHKSNRIKDYIQGYPFQFLVTLTFDDKYLPLARYDDSTYSLVHDIDCDYDGCVYRYQLSDSDNKDMELLLSTIKQFGGVPVLSHRVLINFKKRIRYYLNYYGFKEDVFIYGCGEYGPAKYRPHYHLIFGFKQAIPTSIFKMCVSASWSFSCKTRQGNFREAYGFVNVKRSFGKKSIDYITKYLCCTTHLPCYLAFAKWKPYGSGSTRCDKQLSRLSQSNLREVFYNPSFTVGVVRNGKCSSEPVPNAYKCRYFPLVNKFNDFSDYELYRLYSLYKKYPVSGSAYESFCLDYLKQTDWNNVIEHNSPLNGRDYSLNPLTVLQMAVFHSCFLSDGKYIEDEFIRKRNFMRLYYVSRRVCLNAELLDISVSTYVDKIIDYYHNFELFKLKNFYEFQNEIMSDVFDPVPLDYVFTLYYHTHIGNNISYYAKQFGWHGIKIDDSKLQRNYSLLCDGILLDTTKTKKRNDKFASLGLEPKPFVPRISNKFNRFNFNKF